MSTEGIVIEQANKIEKYEKKLRALIQAYKGLLAEKTALEQTVSALTASDSCSTVPGVCQRLAGETDTSPHSSEEKVIHEDELDNVTSPRNDCSEADAQISEKIQMCADDQLTSDSVNKYTHTISALKRALATLTTEKSKSEAAFTEDRKYIIDEKDAIESKLADQIEACHSLQVLLEQQSSKHDLQVQEMKQQYESEKLRQSLLIKEYEQKIADEKMHCENLTKILTNEKETAKNYLRKVEELKTKIEEYEIRLNALESVDKLKNELENCKIHLTNTIETERRQLSEAKQEIDNTHARHEEMVSCLERKIADLTSTLFEQEKIKIRNEKIIGQLTAQLQDIKNSCDCTYFIPIEVDKQDLAEHCKNVLTAAFTHYPNFNLNDILKSLDVNLHKRCQSKYDTLKREFDFLTQKAEERCVTSVPDNSNILAENMQLRDTVQKLQYRLKDIESKLIVERERHSSEIAALNQIILTLKESHSKDVAVLHATNRLQADEFDEQSCKQRERAAALLAEKEQQIEELKRQVSTPSVSSAIDRSDSRASFHSVDETTVVALGGPVALDASVIYGPPTDPLPSPSTSLHFNKELLRKDIEVQRLRLKLRQQESQLVSAQHELISKELLQSEIMEKLKDEIRDCESRLARQYQHSDLSPESASSHIEYLKNVFVKMVTCNDSTTKLHMLKAICSALKLSYKETDQLLKTYAKSNNVKI